jgi:hypothetical protein
MCCDPSVRFVGSTKAGTRELNAVCYAEGVKRRGGAIDLGIVDSEELPRLFKLSMVLRSTSVRTLFGEVVT